MPQTLILMTSPPHSPEAQRALMLAASLRMRGIAVGVVLLQDAVFAAVRPSASPAAATVDTLLSKAVPVYVAEDDLRLRGFAATRLPTGAQPVDDRRIVDLVMADGTRALGCF
jgi:sulfur relay protein TusB/DsrH